MKTKLLRKLRETGRNQITIYSITKSGGVNTGMSYGYDYNRYKGLFGFGDTEEEVLKKACDIYLKTNILFIREKYYKYSIKNKR